MGTLRVAALAVLVAVVAASCSTTESGTARPSVSPPPTPVDVKLPPGMHKIVLRPVDAHGHVQSGWGVNDSASAIDCDDAKSSPYAVDPGIVDGCGPSADRLGPCWPLPGKYSAVCLRLPIRTGAKQLVRIDTRITVKGQPGKEPKPIAVGLDDDRVCSVVRDGEWGPEGAPDYVCNPDLAGIWHITMTPTGWTANVRAAAGESPHAVTSAYYLGIA